jgi:hypothetical protein
VRIFVVDEIVPWREQSLKVAALVIFRNDATIPLPRSVSVVFVQDNIGLTNPVPRHPPDVMVREVDVWSTKHSVYDCGGRSGDYDTPSSDKEKAIFPPAMESFARVGLG